MRSQNSYRIGVVILAAMFAGLALGGSPPAAPPPRTPPVRELIRRLASEDFTERDDASNQLAALPLDEPPPELLRALESPNPEVRRRADEAARAIRARAEERALGRERVFARRGAIDRFVAAAMAWDVPADDERVWQAVLDVGTTLARKARYRPSMLNSRTTMTPAIFWRVCRNSQLYIRSDERFLVPDKNVFGEPIVARSGGIRAQEVVAGRAIILNLIISNGLVKSGNNISESIILSNTHVSCGDAFTTAIVVCDGDVDVVNNVHHSLIVARGNIRVGGFISHSILIAGGKVTIGKPRQRSPRERTEIQENVRRPLDFVTFFEFSQVGVEVVAADGGVRVTGLTAGQPLAKAGVRKGDLIAKVGKDVVRTPEDLRRQLRDASATKGEAVLTVHRDGQTVDLRVTLPD